MSLIGQIVSANVDQGIDEEKWIALIEAHPSLTTVPQRKGINPFTGKQAQFKAPITSALVCLEGVEIGSIHWATDGSPILIVEAKDGAETSVARLAKEIAAKLGHHFQPETEKP